MELFYLDIQPKRQQIAKIGRMRLQADLEFQQNEMKRLNEKYDVEMFTLRVRGGKAYAAEQKIREFKKLLFLSKKSHKTTPTSAKFDPKKLIHKATANMSNIQSQKYGYPPEAIEENAIKSEKFKDIYDFYMLLKAPKKHAKKYARVDVKKDKLSRRRLREPLKVGKRVLALVEHLKKKDESKHLYKSTTDNVSFFNCEQIFVVRKIVKTSKDNYLYWISKERDDKINDKRFLETRTVCTE